MSGASATLVAGQTCKIMKIKIVLLFLTLALSVGAQTNFIITNLVPSVDTNWLLPSGHAVTDKINANYGNLVGWLNAHSATNSAEDYAISNLTVQVAQIQAMLNTNSPTRYISTNLTLATSAIILFAPPFADTNYGAFQDLSVGLPTSLLITAKTTNSISTTMGLFTGTEAFGLIHN